MKNQDNLYRFLFENLGVRGEWVQLNQSWQSAKRHQTATETVQNQLGQALAAVALLSATIKFKGSMILQAQGEGPIKTLVAQTTEERKIRGLVRGKKPIKEDSLADLFGQGRLVITIETEIGAPYQGIVPLSGKNLASAIETYFDQSEQLKTRLWLFADQNRAAGLLIQELPGKNNNDDWERLTVLADTITEAEMLNLDCEQILHRLFHQEQVRLFPAEPIEFACSCSRGKIENTLRTLGRTELEQIVEEQGKIEVNCEFCGEQYVFDPIDVENVLRQDSTMPSPETRH